MFATQDEVIIRAHQAPWWGGVEMLVRQVIQGPERTYHRVLTHNGKMREGLGYAMIKIEPGEEVYPTFVLSKTAAQVLMDDLWNSGIRPTEGTGSAGQLAATQKHLQDMRKITEKFLKIQLEKI